MPRDGSKQGVDEGRVSASTRPGSTGPVLLPEERLWWHKSLRVMVMLRACEGGRLCRAPESQLEQDKEARSKATERQERDGEGHTEQL